MTFDCIMCGPCVVEADHAFVLLWNVILLLILYNFPLPGPLLNVNGSLARPEFEGGTRISPDQITDSCPCYVCLKPLPGKTLALASILICQVTLSVA
jgi:hypothetical protein